MRYDIYVAEEDIDKSKYIIAHYKLEAHNIRLAAEAIAIGQSIGNPTQESVWETEELIKNHSGLILGDPKFLDKAGGFDPVKIAFPIANINIKSDGITHLLCQLMGGQMDIDHIRGCRLVNLKLPDKIRNELWINNAGISGIRLWTEIKDKPLLGGIIKPKIGLGPNKLLDMVKQMIDGGCDIIKEDEIMSNPLCCPLEERLKLIMPHIENTNIIYYATINADHDELLNKAKLAEQYKAHVHLNVWSGLSSYRFISNNTDRFLHFQRSGHKVITSGRFSITENVLFYLACFCGIDSIHGGMWGGYNNTDDKYLADLLKMFRDFNVMPALSCGMHPGLVATTTNKFGSDYIANVGGAIHNHPGGTLAGTKAMRQAIDDNYGIEYDQAINKWGKR